MKIKMTSNVLKFIAIVTMLIDHITVGLYWNLTNNGEYYTILRDIGRISFPIYCFLLVEGFRHTKNIKKYIGRMLIFAVISEIPFNLAIYGRLEYYMHQNVLFELALGLICMYLVSKVNLTSPYRLLYHAIIIAGCCWLAYFLYLDYSYYGILLIMLGYYIRCTYRVKQSLILAMIWFMFDMHSAIAFIPISFYRGKQGKSFKWLFYAVYPVHLAIIAYVRLQVFGG